MAKKQGNLLAVTAEAVDAIAGDALQLAIEAAGAIGSSVVGGLANVAGMRDSEIVKSENRMKTTVRPKAKTVKSSSHKPSAARKHAAKTRPVKNATKAAKSSARPKARAKAHAKKSATRRAR